MVGYIEDAIIASKVRVRFDGALENTVPDRAEFFYAKCGCYRDLVGLPPYDPEAPGPGPGIVTELNFQQLLVWGEYAFSERASVFGQVPARWIQPQSFAPAPSGSFPNQSGLGDLRAGARFGLAASDDQSITAQVQFDLPTGDAGRGMGTDHPSIEPALLYFQRVNDLVMLESQIGVWLPLEGAAPVPTSADGEFAGDILFYGIGPSFTLYDSGRVQFAPVVELVGWRVLNGYQTGGDDADAGGTNIVNLKVGARTVFGRGSVYFGYGKALTDATWYDDILRVEYRFGF
jgi:hypothetical protein